MAMLGRRNLSGQSYLQNQRLLWSSQALTDLAKPEDTPMVPWEPDKIQKSDTITGRYPKWNHQCRMSLELISHRRNGNFKEVGDSTSG